MEKLSQLRVLSTLTILGLLLSGCGDMRSTVSNEEILMSGKTAPPDYYHPGDTYCYRTLGSTECYKKPLEGQEDRLIGSYKLDPKAAEKKSHGSAGIWDNGKTRSPRRGDGLLTDFLGGAKKRMKKKKDKAAFKKRQKL